MSNRRKVRFLPQSDIDEIVRFEAYLADLKKLPTRELVLKHWEYLGLSREEVEKTLSPKEPAK